jgi:hypothetical protein
MAAPATNRTKRGLPAYRRNATKSGIMKKSATDALWANGDARPIPGIVSSRARLNRHKGGAAINVGSYGRTLSPLGQQRSSFTLVWKDKNPCVGGPQQRSCACGCVFISHLYFSNGMLVIISAELEVSSGSQHKRA